MFIYSIRAQSIKLYLSIALSVLTVISVLAFVPFRQESDVSAVATQNKALEKNDYKNVKTNDDRIAFLKKIGWEVEKEPRDVCEVYVPVEFDPIFEKYNQIQENEGLSLDNYRGKSVKKYTYLVNNYEYNGIVYANLLIDRDRVIAGDICSAISGGFLHGLTKRDLSLT